MFWALTFWDRPGTIFKWKLCLCRVEELSIKSSLCEQSCHPPLSTNTPLQKPCLAASLPLNLVCLLTSLLAMHKTPISLYHTTYVCLRMSNDNECQSISIEMTASCKSCSSFSPSTVQHWKVSLYKSSIALCPVHTEVGIFVLYVCFGLLYTHNLMHEYCIT